MGDSLHTNGKRPLEDWELLLGLAREADVLAKRTEAIAKRNQDLAVSIVNAAKDTNALAREAHVNAVQAMAKAKQAMPEVNHDNFKLDGNVDSSDDDSEIDAMLATVTDIIRSNCPMPWEEIMHRRTLVSTKMDKIMINANETAYCQALQACQTETNDVVWHDMEGNRYLWCAKTLDCGTPHFCPFPVTNGKVCVPEWIVRKGETALYCPKHKYGPMDSWYDCSECSQSHDDAPGPLSNIRSNERREPTAEEVKAREDFLRALPTRNLKIATILRKIPKKDAERYIQLEAASGMNACVD